jgi:hypothetical protein
MGCGAFIGQQHDQFLRSVGAVGQRLLDVGSLGGAGDEEQIGGHRRLPAFRGDSRRQCGKDAVDVQHTEMNGRYQRECAWHLVRVDLEQGAGFGNGAVGNRQAGIDGVEQLCFEFLDRPIEVL